MLHPTIEELTQGKFNRYELALATAKCARIITDEYVRQHDVAERSQTGNKETDRPINTMIDKELRDEKAVKVAIGRIHSGVYYIDEHAAEKQAAAEAAAEAEEADEELETDVPAEESLSDTEGEEA